MVALVPDNQSWQTWVNWSYGCKKRWQYDPCENIAETHRINHMFMMDSQLGVLFNWTHIFLSHHNNTFDLAFHYHSHLISKAHLGGLLCHLRVAIARSHEEVNTFLRLNIYLEYIFLCDWKRVNSHALTNKWFTNLSEPLTCMQGVHLFLFAK